MYILNMSSTTSTLNASSLPKALSLEEKKYLLSVRRGDIGNVQRLIEKAYKNGSLDINCVDSLGRGAFNLAIESENLEMIELLLVMGVDPKDGLLHAIDAEFVEAVELLLEYEEIIHKEGEKYSWEKVDSSSAKFTSDITPLALAAHRNNFEILKILLDRGATIPMPHSIGCSCESCKNECALDSLRHSMSRVNEYRALASPSLIALSSPDPIHRAFQLSWQLRNLAGKEKECQNEYTNLREQCQQFAVDLLDQTRSSEELAIILNQSSSKDSADNNCNINTPEIRQLPRLQLALKYKQKQFIAHPYVQQLLSKIWYDGLPGYRSKHVARKCLTIIGIGVLFPFYCFMYMALPSSKAAQFVTKPVVKFVTHVTSYLVFLGILILVSQRAEVLIIEYFGTESMKMNMMETLKNQRGNPPSFLEWIVFIYVIGYILEEYAMIKRIGIRKHISNTIWNCVELVKNSLYSMVMILRVYAYFKERREIAEYPESAFIPRENWQEYDPQLSAEALFACANILSALKLVHIFSVNSHLGPLQISLGRMIIDIIKFFTIYVLVLFSFACGLNQLMWYYSELERKKCYSLPDGSADWENASNSCSSWRNFANLYESIQTLFWTGFGELEVGSFDIAGMKPYTRFWGITIFASFCVINITVLLNLLIAMMSNSYSTIEQQSDVEWKFARTRLWMNCLEESTTLPPPFNILTFPNFKNIFQIFSSKKEDANSYSQGSTGDQSISKKEQDEKYRRVMKALVWRYVCFKHRLSSGHADITEDDVNEIKADISALKYEMWEVFRNQGMCVPSDENKDKVLSKKMRMWERQLMKDFHVGPIAPNKEQPPSPVPESALNKFRNAAKQVTMSSPSRKWHITIEGVRKVSQIGRCSTQESLEKQMALEKAMNAAKSYILDSSNVAGGDKHLPYKMPPSRPSLLDLMKLARKASVDAGLLQSNV